MTFEMEPRVLLSMLCQHLQGIFCQHLSNSTTDGDLVALVLRMAAKNPPNETTIWPHQTCQITLRTLKVVASVLVKSWVTNLRPHLGTSRKLTSPWKNGGRLWKAEN